MDTTMNEHISKACMQWLNATQRKPPTEAELLRDKQDRCGHTWDIARRCCTHCGINESEFYMRRYQK